MTIFITVNHGKSYNFIILAKTIEIFINGINSAIFGLSLYLSDQTHFPFKTGLKHTILLVFGSSY